MKIRPVKLSFYEKWRTTLWFAMGAASAFPVFIADGTFGWHFLGLLPILAMIACADRSSWDYRLGQKVWRRG